MQHGVAEEPAEHKAQQAVAASAPKAQDKEKDDNPDIGKYMGYGDLRTSYRINEKHTLSTLTRFNFGSGKGAMEVSYTFPIKGKLKAYLQGFYGYGENLIDYNHKQKGIGLGVMFRDWDGL